MAKALSAVRAIVRQYLRDEFAADSLGYDFQDDELDLHIEQCLVEISQKRPYEVRETVVSTGSKEIDISSIPDLLEVEKAEYPIDGDPPNFRDVSVFGNILRLKVDNVPRAGENIHLYCHKVHKLTETTSTLNAELEKVLIEGAVAKAALAWVNQIRVQIVKAGETVKSLTTAIEDMSARINQAVADLESGRPLINKVNIGGSPETDWANYASRELSNANANLNKANGYVNKLSAELNIGAAIARYQAWANNQLVLYQNSLTGITRAKVWEFYPTS